MASEQSHHRLADKEHAPKWYPMAPFLLVL